MDFLIRNSSTTTLASDVSERNSLPPSPIEPSNETNKRENERMANLTIAEPRLHFHPNLIPSILTTVLTYLERQQTKEAQSTTSPFYALELPPISVYNYIERFVRFSYCPPAGILTSIYYVKKLVEENLIKITRETIHRLILTSIVISAKCCTDFFLSNEYYAKVGGVCLKELNILEEEMLNLLDWKVFVSEWIYVNDIECYTLDIIRKFGNDQLKNVLVQFGFDRVIENVEEEERGEDEEQEEEGEDDSDGDDTHNDNDHHHHHVDDRHEDRFVIGRKKNASLVERFVTSPCSSIQSSPSLSPFSR